MTLSVVPPKPEPPRAHCGFCGKSAEEVARLVAGPIVCICNECIELCGGIVAVPEDETERRTAALKEHLETRRLLKRADAAICYLRKISQYPTLYEMPDEIAASIKEAQDRQAQRPS